jgi:hypothetical protein
MSHRAAGILQRLDRLEAENQELRQQNERLENLFHQTVTTAYKQYCCKIALFGALSGEMVFAEDRPVIPSATTLISPDFGNDTMVYHTRVQIKF